MKLPIALLAASAFASTAGAVSPITPGYWESTNRLLSPIQQQSVEKRCITAADVEKFMGGPSNRRYSCTYPTRMIAGGKIRLKGTCVDKKGREIAVEGHGVYTSASFSLKASIAMDFLGLPIQGEATTDARRIGDACPSPEAPPPAATQAAPSTATDPGAGTPPAADQPSAAQ